MIDKFRKELKEMMDDLSEVDMKVLNKSIYAGVGVAKRKTNVVTGFMRKSWGVTPTVRSSKGVEKGIINTADYASYVNDGHRQQVSRYVPAIGKRLVKPWVKGQYILEKAMRHAEKTMVKEFKKEIDRINKKHNK